MKYLKFNIIFLMLLLLLLIGLYGIVVLKSNTKIIVESCGVEYSELGPSTIGYYSSQGYYVVITKNIPNFVENYADKHESCHAMVNLSYTHFCELYK